MTGEDRAITPARTAAALAIGVGFILLTAFGIRYSEMVTGRYLSNGVPPVAAFASALVLVGLRAALRRHVPALAPTRAQILIVYVMLTVATILSGSYHIRAFLPHLVALQYHERPGGSMAGGELSRFLPAWLAPRDPAVAEAFYNGSKTRQVPWDAWALPLAAWSLFLGALFAGVYCLMRLIHRQWIQDEKLSFPLLSLPLSLAADAGGGFGNPQNRRALFLCGLAIPVAYNGINILHIFQPSVPSPGFYLTFSDAFQNHPWQPFGQVYLFFMLEAIGIGYFVPLEITFSAWFFYLLNRLYATAGIALGYESPGWPFTQEQAAGGYVAVGLLLLWGLRRSLRESWERAFSAGGDWSERGAWIGLLGCSALVLAFCQAAGFSWKLALPFFAVLTLYVLVYARLRAETGIPFGFIYPYSLPKEGLLNLVGFKTALMSGGVGSMVLFSTMAWLSRHHFAMEHAAYQLDGIKAGQEARIRQRTLTGALLLAFGVGLAAAFWVHLDAYYKIGANLAGGGTGAGEFRAVVAFQEYQQLAGRLQSPPVREMGKLWGMGVGFVFTSFLYALRLRWVGFPLHPLGFLLGTAYGDSANNWFALLVAWLCKACILKIGGMNYYRQGMPFFLGIAVGHYFMAGIFWPLLSSMIDKDLSQAYHIYFGG